jgi:hypothetical protein
MTNAILSNHRRHFLENCLMRTTLCSAADHNKVPVPIAEFEEKNAHENAFPS